MTVNPFRDAQEAKNEALRLNKCQFCKGVTALDVEKRELLKAAFDDDFVDAGTITAVLRDWGVRFTETVIITHRNGSRPHCNARVARSWELLK